MSCGRRSAIAFLTPRNPGEGIIFRNRFRAGHKKKPNFFGAYAPAASVASPRHTLPRKPGGGSPYALNPSTRVAPPWAAGDVIPRSHFWGPRGGLSPLQWGFRARVGDTPSESGRGLESHRKQCILGNTPSESGRGLESCRIASSTVHTPGFRGGAGLGCSRLAGFLSHGGDGIKPH